MTTSSVERQIAEAVARAGGLSLSKLGLRFDRVATRVLSDLTRFAAATSAADTTVLLTLTAPIRLPAQTARAIEREIATLAVGGDRVLVLCGNEVRLRLVEQSRRDHSLVGFVHNRDVDAARLLDLAEAWLRAEP